MDAWVQAVQVGAGYGARILVETLPTILGNQAHVFQTIQMSWDRAWKHSVLNEILPFWSHATGAARAKMPPCVQEVISVLPSDLLVFDNTLLPVSGHTPPIFHQPHAREPVDQTDKCRFSSYASPTSSNSLGSFANDFPSERCTPNRLIFLFHSQNGTIHPQLAYFEFADPASSPRMVAFTAIKSMKCASLEQQSQVFSMLLSNLRKNQSDCLHAMTAHISIALRRCSLTNDLSQHPLSFVTHFLDDEFQKLHAYDIDQGFTPTDTTCRNKKTPFATEEFLDVRQRILSQHSMSDLPPNKLEAKRNHANAFFTRPSIKQRSVFDSMYGVYSTIRERKKQMPDGLLRHFEKRCWSEEEMMKLLQQIPLSTNENIQLKRWSDMVQSELNLVTNFTKEKSMWPYRVICLISDLLCFLSFQKEQLSKMHPAMWQEAGSDNILEALTRIQKWILNDRVNNVDEISRSMFARFQSHVEAQNT